MISLSIRFQFIVIHLWREDLRPPLRTYSQVSIFLELDLQVGSACFASLLFFNRRLSGSALDSSRRYKAMTSNEFEQTRQLFKFEIRERVVYFALLIRFYKVRLLL